MGVYLTRVYSGSTRFTPLPHIHMAALLCDSA
jgi:hypothetical protein